MTQTMNTTNANIAAQHTALDTKIIKLPIELRMKHVLIDYYDQKVGGNTSENELLLKDLARIDLRFLKKMRNVGVVTLIKIEDFIKSNNIPHIDYDDKRKVKRELKHYNAVKSQNHKSLWL